MSPREIYYHDIVLFGKQSVVDDVSCHLRKPQLIVDLSGTVGG